MNYRNCWNIRCLYIVVLVQLFILLIYITLASNVLIRTAFQPLTSGRQDPFKTTNRFLIKTKPFLKCLIKLLKENFNAWNGLESVFPNMYRYPDPATHFREILFSQKIIKEHHPAPTPLPPKEKKILNFCAPGQLVEGAHYSNLLNVIVLSEWKKVFFLLQLWIFEDFV